MKSLSYCFILLYFLVSASCKSDRSVNPGQAFSGNDTASINSVLRNAQKLVRNDPDSVISLLHLVIDRSVTGKYVKGIGGAYWLMGLANFYEYRYDSALHLYEIAYTTFSRIRDRHGMANTLFSMSYAYSALQVMDKSLACAEAAKVLYEELQDYDQVYDCTEGLIYINKQLNKAQVVDSLVNVLNAIAEKTKDKKKLASSYIILGNHYLDKAFLNLAIETFYQALTLAEETGDPVEIADAQGSIGLANLYLHEYQTAISYYLKQEEILVTRNNFYELTKTYTGLGEAYNSLKQYEKGLAYHLKSLQMSKKMNFMPSLSNSLQNVAYTYYLMQGNLNIALDYVTESTRINTRIRNHNKLADNYLLSGRICLFIRDYPKAITVLERSLVLAQQYNNPKVVMDASGLLCTYYADKGAYEKAYRYNQINNEISDSLMSRDNLKRITQLEMQRAYDKQNNESEFRHLQEKMVMEAELRKDRMIRNYSLAMGLLLTGFGFFLYYSYRKSKTADKEKEALLKEIHHRIKNNLMVISSLLNLQSGTITDDNTRNAMRESQNRVKSMALIHQLLYQSERFTGIDFAQYLEELMQYLQISYSKPDKNINYLIRAESIKLDIDTAVPLGLITNELTTNAYKYAFSDNGGGNIIVDFNKTPDHKYLLRVSDDGKGMPEGFDLDGSSTLGLKLVKILSRQIKAKLTFSGHKGTEFKVVFSINP